MQSFEKVSLNYIRRRRVVLSPLPGRPDYTLLLNHD